MATKAKMRQQVLDFINSTESKGSTLKFGHALPGGKVQFFKIPKKDLDYDYLGNLKIKSLVKLILEMSEKYYSFQGSNIECTPGRRRSAYDIWRHAKSVDSSIDIFQIMRALYDINNEPDSWLSSDFCSTILRTVFFIQDRDDWTVVETSDYEYAWDLDNDDDDSEPISVDEFGLVFEQWKAI